MRCFQMRSLLMLTTILSSQSYAACLPAATDNNDVIICDSSTTGQINGLLGDDEITINEGASMSVIYGTRPTTTSGSYVGGNDKITVLNAQEARFIYGDTASGLTELKAGSDTIIVEGTTTLEIYGDYFLLSENSSVADDIIFIKASKATAVTGDFIYGTVPVQSVGNDTITIDSSEVDFIQGDFVSPGLAGSDIIKVVNGSVINKVVSGDMFDATLGASYDTYGGDDTIIVENSTILGNDYNFSIAGDFFKGGAPSQKYVTGNDIIIINNSTLKKSVYTDDPDDSNVNDTRIFGNDEITLSNAVIEGSIYLSGGNDTLTLIGDNQAIKIWGGDPDGKNEEGYIDHLNISSYVGSVSDIIIPDTEGFEYFGVIENSEIDFGDSYASPTVYERYIVDESSNLIMTGGGLGDYIINGDVYNGGTLNFIDDKVGDKLTVTGDYIETSAQSYLQFDTDLYTLKSDMLVVEGEMKTVNSFIMIRDQVTGSTSNLGDIVLITVLNDTNRLDETFLFAPLNQYNNNPNEARFSTSPFVWYLKPSGNSWILSAIEDGSTSGGGTETDGGGTETDGGGIETDGGGTETDGGGTETDGGGTETDGGGIETDGGGTETDGGGTETDGGGTETDSGKTPIVAEIPAYANLPSIARTIIMDELGTLHSRLGELRNNNGWVGSRPSNIKTNLDKGWKNQISFDDNEVSSWIKTSIHHMDYASSDTGFDAEGQYGGINLGLDKKFDISTHWNSYIGVFTAYKTGKFETSGEGDVYYSKEYANIDTKARSFGAYATLYNDKGFYFDILGEYVLLTANIEAAGLRSEAKGHAIAGSVEVGHRFDLMKDLIIEPQIQIKAVKVHWDDLFDLVHEVEFDTPTYIAASGGVRLEKTFRWEDREIKPWIYAGVKQELSDGASIKVAGLDFEDHATGFVSSFSSGITVDIRDNIQLYGDVGYESDFENYKTVSGNFGLRISW